MNSYVIKNIDGSSYISHHGITGQKWGHRNGPPYPLGASDHSAAEKKAGTSDWTKEAKNESKKSSNKETSNKETSNKETSVSIKKEEYDYRDLGLNATGVKTEYSNSGNKQTKISKQLDSVEPHDYDDDFAEKANIVAMRALKEYEKNGDEGVAKLLKEEFGDMKYEIAISNEKYIDYGKEILGYQLTLYGDKIVYQTQGQKDYYDGDYFYKRK